MGLQVIEKRTLVFQLGCLCNACEEKVQKHLQQIEGIGSVAFDARERKITIEGTNLNPVMVISKLKSIKKKAELLAEENSKMNQIEEKQNVIHSTEALTEKPVMVVASAPRANNQVLDGSAFQTSSHFHSKHDHERELELKNYNKSQMDLQVTGERTLFFQLINGCSCDGCSKKMQTHLQQIGGIGFVAFDADERKITIKGTNLDPVMVILELKTIKKNAELLTEENSKMNQIEEKPDVTHPKEALAEKPVTVGACIPPANNQALDGSSFRTSSQFHSKHDHECELELKNYNKSQMDLQVIGERTSVLQLCKHLQQLNGIGLATLDADERKITTEGTNLDPNMVTLALKTIMKGTKLLPEDNSKIDQKEEKQDAIHSIGDLREEADNRVLGKSTLWKSQHFHSQHDHEHELEFKDYKKRFTCNGCKEGGIGSRYRCKHCDYELHCDCMNPKPTISHELYRGSIFEFSRDKLLPTCGDSRCRDHVQRCEACGTRILGYAYHCKTEGLSLRPSCVKLNGKLCIQGSTFTLKKKAPCSCIWCGDKTKAETDYGWAYVSEDKQCGFHVNCIAKIAHETWDKRSVESDDDDAYRVVLEERLNLGLIKHSKRNRWSKGCKIFKTIIVFVRTVIGILLGDPSVILASMLVEAFKT